MESEGWDIVRQVNQIALLDNSGGWVELFA